jgi:selenide,water dikinase
VRPVDHFVPRWDEICNRTVRGQAPRRVAVVGGGAAGVEVLLAMQYRLCRLAPMSQISFELVSDGGSILLSHNSSVHAIFMRVLEQRGVTLHLGRAAERVESGVVRLSGGASVEADAIVWATGASAPSWPKVFGLATDDGGFVRVNRWLQSVSHPQVFAAGDIASVAGEPRPKSGVYAVRAGPPLAKNLRRMLRGEALVDWTPQKDALALITTGDRYAVASRGSLALEGKWVWHWKNWIDRRFMRKYRNP